MEILQIVLTAATGSGVTAIILAILQRKWTKDDKRDAIAKRDAGREMDRAMKARR